MRNSWIPSWALADYVLDTSAILAALLEEPGSEEIERLLQLASEMGGPILWLPFMTAMEVEYGLQRLVPRGELAKVLDVMASWPTRLVESDAQWRHRAARIKLGYRLSLADAWIAAYALLRGDALVHKDPEFDQIQGLQHFRLPYKPKHE
jgi:predicted nucleic acid-binding protein